MASVCTQGSIYRQHPHSEKRKALPVPSLTHRRKTLPIRHGSETWVLDMAVSVSTIHVFLGLHLLLAHSLRASLAPHSTWIKGHTSFLSLKMNSDFQIESLDFSWSLA